MKLLSAVQFVFKFCQYINVLHSNSVDDTSGTKWDSSDGSSEDRYDGYHTLPTSDGAFEIGSTDNENINSVVEERFVKVNLYAFFFV